MEQQNDETYGRRQLLKALAATSGAILATTSLPNEWTEPNLDVGYLPAHAQTSIVNEELPPLACIEPGNQIDVMVSVDVSGSMDFELPFAKEALKRFVDGLDLVTVEQMGVVSFSDTTVLDLPLSQDATAIKTSIDALTIRTSTILGPSLEECASQLMGPAHRIGNQRVIILLSDGEAQDDPIPIATTIKKSGITILTVGIGTAIDVITLKTIASSNGDFYFTPEGIDLITIFDPVCDL